MRAFSFSVLTSRQRSRLLSTDWPIDRRDQQDPTAPKGLTDLDLLNHGPVAPSPSRSAGLGELAAGADGLDQSVLRRRLDPQPWAGGLLLITADALVARYPGPVRHQGSF